MEIIKEIMPYVQNGSRESRSLQTRASTKEFTVHYTGNPGSTARGNINYFRDGRDVNSTFVIDLDGTIYQILPLDEKPWTNGDQSNNWSVTVECCHPDSSGKFTQETYSALVWLGNYVCKYYGLDPLTDIKRHSDHVNTDCPKWFTEHQLDWEQYKNDVKSLSIANNSLGANSENKVKRYVAMENIGRLGGKELLEVEGNTVILRAKLETNPTRARKINGGFISVGENIYASQEIALRRDTTWSSEIIKDVPANSPVKVLEDAPRLGWIKVYYDGVAGFVDAGFIKFR